jgi:hypothetical protein
MAPKRACVAHLASGCIARSGAVAWGTDSLRTTKNARAWHARGGSMDRDGPSNGAADHCRRGC